MTTLPVDLTERLARVDHNVDTVVQENLAGKDDPTVWKTAQEEGRFLIPQDFCFTDIREHTPGTQDGVLLVCLVDPSREALIRRIVTIFETEEVSARRGNVVATIENHDIGAFFEVETSREARWQHPQLQGLMLQNGTVIPTFKSPFDIIRGLAADAPEADRKLSHSSGTKKQVAGNPTTCPVVLPRLDKF